ncbi:MAG: endopeptidase La [Bacteroidales bacterium]|nr:endopeptidase La [Bacteroidales bacterium]
MRKDYLDDWDDTGDTKDSLHAIVEIPTEPMKPMKGVIDFEKEMMVMPLRNMVMFPMVVLPISIGRKSTLQMIRSAQRKGLLVAVFTQVSDETEEPKYNDLYHTGVMARVVKIFELNDESVTVVMQSVGVKVELKKLTKTSPFLKGMVAPLDENMRVEKTPEFRALYESFRDATLHFVNTSDELPPDSAFAVRAINAPEVIVSFVASHFPFPIAEKIELLRMDTLKDKLYKLIAILNREQQLTDIKLRINKQTHEDLNKQQREYFLHQQLKNIQSELGDSEESEYAELKSKAAQKQWSEAVNDHFTKELEKLQRFNSQSPDYSLQLNYLQTMVNLPWNVYTEDNHDIRYAERVLNADHYGLEKVKERILEYLAVLRQKGDLKAPIICLYGPPGVGKTSLGKSVAKALKRKYVRMSLGGVHDEAEIRGHRRTYIGAMPGRIISSMLKAGAGNPVIILDEIDKLATDGRGDPASAMLEVLDPEQNSAFHDNYLDVDYDLSKVMFIATANNLSTIPTALLDRMELIEVSGYITEEKLEIAKRHLIPKELDNTGFDKSMVKFNKNSIELIVENYTRESGVRELEKKINKIIRQIALANARTDEATLVNITPERVRKYLGVAEYTRDKYQGNEYAGVVTGLAWTAVGGEILFVETSLSKGKGEKLTLTGNLGDVMKESAMLALEYLKAHPQLLGLADDVFDHWNIHIHVPEGAIPKDGPSAGVTMVTSLASALTQKKVRPFLAMTGEITLRGKVLPVGGIREKILAAKRSGIKEIILCSENKKNIDEIPAHYLTGITFHYVDDIKEVLDLSLNWE